jgi:hypothetical protein
VSNETRFRGIVIRAAALSRSARALLREDSRGFWQARARQMVVDTNERARALGLSDEAQDEQVATRLALDAVEGLIRQVGRRQRRNNA